MIHVDVLAEVGLNALHAHIEQWLQQGVLIPVGGLVVSEIDSSRIVEGGEVGSTSCPRVLFLRWLTNELIRLGLFKLFSTQSDVRQLPERDLETLLGKPPDEAFGVREPLGVELPFTEPVGTEPPSIEVDDITGIVLVSQTVTDVLYLVSRKVGHATHPDAKAPKGRHLRKAR